MAGLLLSRPGCLFPPPFRLDCRPERRERDAELSGHMAPPNRPHGPAESARRRDFLGGPGTSSRRAQADLPSLDAASPPTYGRPFDQLKCTRQMHRENAPARNQAWKWPVRLTALACQQSLHSATIVATSRPGSPSHGTAHAQPSPWQSDALTGPLSGSQRPS